MKELLTGLFLSLATTTVVADTMRIAVATNFKPTLQLIAEQFTITTGHTVSLSGASTGQLYAQIKNGAPFDLFFAADRSRPAKLHADGYAIESFTYANGKLALCSTRIAINGDVEGWLQKTPADRLAIANPRLAPYGKAAIEVLAATNSYEKFAGKLIRGENIGQTFQFMISGNVTAGLVADSQRLRADTTSVSCQPVPASLHDPIEQQAVLLTEKPAARSFMDFVRSPAITTIIETTGYDLPNRN